MSSKPRTVPKKRGRRESCGYVTPFEGIEPLTMAEAVCARPRMWTAKGTLAEVLAFISGFEAGRNRGALERDLPEREPDHSLAEVEDWLAKQCGMERIGSWPPVYRNLDEVVKKFGTEEKALEALQDYVKKKQARRRKAAAAREAGAGPRKGRK